jgi:HEAT repeat protein
MARRWLLGVFAGLGLALLTGPQPAGAQYLGKSVSDWGDALKSNDPAARRSAAFALGKTGSLGSGYLPQLLRLVRQDNSAGVREAVAVTIGEVCKGNRGAVENGEVVRTLAQVVGSDADPLVRRSAAVSLGNIRHDAAAAQGALERALSDASPAVRQNAAWALGQIKTTSVAALKKGLRDPDPLVVRDSAKALGNLGEKAHAALSELLIACENPDTETKKAALVTLVGVVGPEDTVANGPIGRALASSKDKEVRYNAALAMGNIGGEGARPAVPVLVEALLQSGDKELRKQAAAVLKNIGPAAGEALNALRQALRDPDPELRKNAAVALGGLAKAAEPAYQDLVQVVENRNEVPDVRIQSAVALSRMGPVPAAKEAAPRLIAVVKDAKNPPEVRLRSLWALRVLNQGLKDFPELFDALDRIVAEPKMQESRMLRYDAAFLLGVFKRAEVSKAAMDVLNDFLHDDTVQIYAGAKGTGTGVGEKGTGAGKVVESGKGDGRVMAVQALRYIGAEKVATRKDIVQQLRALRNSPDERLRGEITTVLSKLPD